MSHHPNSRKLAQRLGLGTGLAALIALAGLAFLWQSQSKADPVDYSMKTLAHFPAQDKLQVAVTLNHEPGQNLKGNLKAELVDEVGKVVQTVNTDIDQKDATGSYKLEFAAKKDQAGKLNLRTHFQDRSQDVKLGDIVLAKPHETTLMAGQEYYAGSRAALQCKVNGVKSLAELIPLDAQVEITLRDDKNNAHKLFQGQTDNRGETLAQFQLPEVAPGQYTLEVVTKSALGEEKLTNNVTVKEDAKILLVTDRPMYQPGHEMHIRALMLRPYDLKPVADTELVFEIEDGKGNKVYRKSEKTSEYGIAHIDFQLASEVNMGDYQIRATAGNKQAQKSVAVKRYVLPKFKNEVTTNKKFYLPKETIEGSLQADYFFGKPISGGKVLIEASTFDVQFRKFETINTQTDDNGHVKFEVKLPDYFVGQPIQQGNALVKLDIKITDTADHSETITKTYTVSDKPIQVNLIAEGGKLVPEMENRVFAAAIYPDGSPAQCDVELWMGNKAEGKPLATVKTNEAGLAEFKFTPDAKKFRQGQFGQRPFEMLGGQQFGWGPEILLDITAKAKDAKGTTVQTMITLNSQPLGDNVLLRLDKAIYAPGDTLKADIRTSAGLPTVYLDIIRGGQTLLTRWIEVKDGQASGTMDLPPELFGSLEVHAYQMLNSGAIVRDSRVVYVQAKNDLQIKVEPNKTVHTPGEMGRIRFLVTDAKGAPTQAALGVIIVDEAVYALQEMQPGLEKVYFTLQEELLKPNVQAKFQPAENFPVLIQQPGLPAGRQQIAQALLTAIEVKAPARWQVAPALQRKQEFQGRMQQVGWALWNAQWQKGDLIQINKQTRKVEFKADVLDFLVQKNFITKDFLKGPFGETVSLNSLAEVSPDFTADHLAQSITWHRLNNLSSWVAAHMNQNKAKYYNEKTKSWTFTKDVIPLAIAKYAGTNQSWKTDAYGQPFAVAKRDKADKDLPMGLEQFKEFELISVGPDGKAGTKDDIRHGNQPQWVMNGGMWWMDGGDMPIGLPRNGMGGQHLWMLRGGMQNNMMLERAVGGVGGFPGGAPMADNALQPLALANPQGVADAGVSQGGGQAPPRIREFFPETMLWQPALITDKNGVADLNVAFADSITTWRLSASASSKAGSLGGVTVPLKVFQDFFVDIDVPINLTQGDEVAFPVAVFNYLDQPQTVKIELKLEPWFNLIDTQGATRTLNLKPNEVTSVSFRVQAKKVGNNPITVMAIGTKKSDAIRRVVEVVPNGERFETVVNDRLKETVIQTIDIPQNAIDDSSKLVVKIYPGVMAQVIEGLEGMMQMPGGCFEQTSSSAYPNILVVNYIKKTNMASPKTLMKAEQYLNAGYQRLLTFERPGGGFDWWGSGEPLIWLSAYGLQEFNDMQKVWPVDRGIIDRTQNFLMNKMGKDGTWSTIGDTHGETIASMGNPKLLLTSYVTWSLLESKMPKEKLAKSIQYIRDNVKEANGNPYILALAANALASYDPLHDSTLDTITKLDQLHQNMPEWNAQCYPCKTPSLTYARGDGVTVETTALTVLAMLKTGGFTNQVNRSLTYLIKAKQSNGAWGSTQASILALKALLGAQEGNRHKGETPFTILVNGKEASRGKITEDNSDITHVFDLKEFTRVGQNAVEIRVEGKCDLMYQIVGRHYEPWKDAKPEQKPVFDIDVTYDRTKLATNDTLKATATLKYLGSAETNMVMLELGVAPGFTVDGGEFAEMVASKEVQRFTITPTRVTLYLGKVMQPGEVRTFDYTLRAKYPLRAQTPVTTAYEYYTPGNRGVAQPVELTVENKK
jgi:hypothetical protein